MHVKITKCLDCWFSVDVATSMLVDKRKSVIFFLKESCQVVLFFFELLCDHSYETFLAILSHGTICFSAFYRMTFLEQLSSNLYLSLIHNRNMAI